ncbi:CU044_5270 family protein [Streptomyces sp. NPDC086091]|uniref:CU044_5270 family protein n=1 Tax=Streptomyces sp. NPDC086091 TaxID=3365751 RepID=UPI0037FDE847
MNAAPAGNAGPEPTPRVPADTWETDELGDVRAELARLLPAGPVERGLPPGRRSHHKDLLMQFIDRDQRDEHERRGGEQDASVWQLSRPARRLSRPVRGLSWPVRGLSRPVRGLSRPVLLAAAVAVAVGAALTVGLATDRQGPGDGGGPSVAVGRGATVTLDRIAAVAQRTEAGPVRPDQFVYVRTLAAENTGVFDGPVKLGELKKSESWITQRNGTVVDLGLLREDGKDLPIEVGVPDGTDPADGGLPVGLKRPTYAWLAALPTDPKALLARISAETPADPDFEHDQLVFDQIGSLISAEVLPPATAAALYKAAALIPGVTEAADGVDAAGRHGIVIAREDKKHATRTEWIFDRKTLVYLGERSVFTKDTRRGRAGALAGISAVLERAVVDRKGQTPGGRTPGA